MKISHLLFEGSESRNFGFIDDLAYTEDAVLISKLFVCRIPKKVPAKEVRRYFSQFGEIESVNFPPWQGRRCPFKMAFVCFTEASFAANALSNQSHFLAEKPIRVKAAESWHQPGADEARLSADAGNVAISKEDHNTIDVNDHCLEYLFQFFTLSEQARFSRVCQRFCQVFQTVSELMYKELDLSLLVPLTLWEIRDFFILIGRHIETIEGVLRVKHCGQIMQFIATNCINLKSLYLYDCNVRSEVFFRMKSLNNVKELCLKNCLLTDESIKAFQKMKSLETLDISQNFNITGRHLMKLKKIKQLVLRECFDVHSEHLIEVCESLPALQSLDIIRCENASTVEFYNAVVRCKQLEELKITCNNVTYELVAQLRSLKRLELWNASTLMGISRTQVFADLVQYKANDLESLKIMSKNTLTEERIHFISQLKKLKNLYVAFNNSVNNSTLRKWCELEMLQLIVVKHCANITNVGILDLLTWCKNLQYINVNGCHQIDVQLVPKALKILQLRKPKLEGPLVLVAKGTAITEQALLDLPEYNKATKATLLKVEFNLLSLERSIDDQVEIYESWRGFELFDDLMFPEGWYERPQVEEQQ